MWCVAISKQSNDIKLESVTWDLNFLKKIKTLCLSIKNYMGVIPKDKNISFNGYINRYFYMNIGKTKIIQNLNKYLISLKNIEIRIYISKIILISIVNKSIY